tara:strand:+ start:135 stop:356 length:222 start_codon:yes stop_codon:yes gene_type:complete
MDININLPNIKEIDCIKLHKMMFIYNAVQTGWEVKMNKGAYIFRKKHEGKQEIYSESYLQSFINSNMDINLLK